MEEESSKLERKQLEESARKTAFTLGNYSVFYDFTKCFEICKRRYENRDLDNLSPSFRILQEAETKIEFFCLQLKTMGGTRRFFYSTFPRNMFLDVKDLFCNIFFKVEGILDLLFSFKDLNFKKRIDELELTCQKRQDLKRLTTIRDKLVHVLGYAKPKKGGDPSFTELIQNGIQKIDFNDDPDEQLIPEDDIINLQIWVRLIEILLDIVSSISY